MTTAVFSILFVVKRMRFAVCLGVIALVVSGCYAPLHTPGIQARTLPDEYRIPFRSSAPRLNYSRLTAVPPRDYGLGPGDVLEVTVPDLYDGAVTEPITARVMSSGQMQLPLIPTLNVRGMNLVEAQRAITRSYDRILKTPRISVSLVEKATVDVVVLGEVNSPGIVSLPKYQNDVGHALAAAGGLSREAAEAIEVHRHSERISVHALNQSGESIELLPPLENQQSQLQTAKSIQRIPLRGEPFQLAQKDVILNSGDVVVVPSRSNEVFFVVGQLDDSNLVRFSLGDRERELGTGLVLPRDRDVDVVTAVAMAGYIDPIDSPITVSVHRVKPDGSPMMIKVNLIKARYDRKETIMVQPGDIIYVNPDARWWIQRTFDRIVTDVFRFPYQALFR